MNLNTKINTEMLISTLRLAMYQKFDDYVAQRLEKDKRKTLSDERFAKDEISAEVSQ